MTIRTLACIALSLCFTGPAMSVQGADDGWTLSDLNPFSKLSSDRQAPSRNDSSVGAFKMPKFPAWGKSETRSRSRVKPSTWSRITNGTKSAWTKTKDALNPWDDPKPAKSRFGTPGSSYRSSRKEPEKKFSLTGWMFPEEESQKPRTVTEFLNQPRPKF